MGFRFKLIDAGNPVGIEKKKSVLRKVQSAENSPRI
jgi:hypothetical protein